MIYNYIKCHNCGDIKLHNNIQENCEVCLSEDIKEFNSELNLLEESFITNESIAYYAPMAEKKVFNTVPSLDMQKRRMMTTFLYSKNKKIESAFITDLDKPDTNFSINLEEISGDVKLSPNLVDVSYSHILKDIDEDYYYKSFIVEDFCIDINESVDLINNGFLNISEDYLNKTSNVYQTKEFVLTRSVLNLLETLGIEMINGDINNYLVTTDYIMNSPLITESVSELQIVKEHRIYSYLNLDNRAKYNEKLSKYVSGINLDEVTIAKCVNDLFRTSDGKVLSKPVSIDQILTGNAKFDNLDDVEDKEKAVIFTHNLKGMMLAMALDSFDLPVSQRFALADNIAESDISILAVSLSEEDRSLNMIGMELLEDDVFDYVNFSEFFQFNNELYDTIEYVFSESAEIISAIKFKSENNLILSEDITSSKRQEIETMIYSVFSALDRTDANTKKYRELYNRMSDKEFAKYMNLIANDPNTHFYLEVLPNKSEPGLHDIRRALEVLGVPENEYVYFKHDGHADDPIRTRYPVLVGYLNVRRLRAKRYVRKVMKITGDYMLPNMVITL